jgi:hypothetical protein
LEATAQYYSNAHCGYIFWDLFYSRTDRCSELEKKKIVNINLLSLLLNYISQIIDLIVRIFNKLELSSKFVIMCGFLIAFLFLIIIIIAFFIIYFKKPKKLDIKTKKTKRAFLELFKKKNKHF